MTGIGVERMVRFGLDGTEYEIDLKAGHRQQMHDAGGLCEGCPTS
jgi:hypothetical protein